MPLLTPLNVPRTNVASQNRILYEDGRGAQEFFTPSHEYFGRQVCPHDNKWKDGTPSFMAPVRHFHILQEEKFYFESGSGYWSMKGQKIKLVKGEEITIPRCVGHTFESIPNEKEEPLVILWRYDSQYWEMEERFFRNTLTYMDDCRKIGVQPSPLQLCVFLTDCWMPGDFIPCPGGEYVRCAVNALFIWVMAATGVVLYGYKRSYIEYYDPAISQKRIAVENGTKTK